MVRLIDADAVPIEPSIHGKAMRAMLDAAPTIECDTCAQAERNGGRCRGTFHDEIQPGGGSGCSAWEKVADAP